LLWGQGCSGFSAANNPFSKEGRDPFFADENPWGNIEKVTFLLHMKNGCHGEYQDRTSPLADVSAAPSLCFSKFKETKRGIGWDY
jgi:hypothetical protein